MQRRRLYWIMLTCGLIERNARELILNTKLLGMIGALAMMAPAGAMAMPAAGLAPVAAPQVTADGATLERAAIIVRTGRPFVRARPFVRERPFVRRGFGRPGIGVGVGPRGGVGVRIR